VSFRSFFIVLGGCDTFACRAITPATSGSQFVERMSMHAKRLERVSRIDVPALAERIVVIVLGGSDEEMSRIQTCPDIAFVANEKAARNRSIFLLECQTMDAPAGEGAIAFANLWAHPQPTATRFLHFRMFNDPHSATSLAGKCHSVFCQFVHAASAEDYFPKMRF
jgi:hypothetical protein